MASIAFTNVNVIDGTGTPGYKADVRITDKRIETIAAHGTVLDVGDAQVIDGKGAILMPGLVESHAHPSFGNTSTLEALGDIPPEEHTLLAMKHVRQLLEHGFTSINSAAAAKPRLDVVIRNAINAGDIPGPRMIAASPELTVTGGLGDVRRAHIHHESFAIVCDGPEEFRQVSRQMVREGVNTLKINPSGDEFVPFARANDTVMNEAEVAAVCEVARSRTGIRVAAHARSAESVKMCVRNGIDIIYHATLCDEEALDMLESVKDRVFVSPTIGVTHTTLYEASDWGITEEVATGLGLKHELEQAVISMQALHKRGVRILPGGDYGFAWNPIPTNARDLEHFVNYLGFTPMEAIISATKFGGEIMLMGDELGQVKEGYLADLLLVDGDPSVDVSILQDSSRLLAIMQEGTLFKAPAGLA